MDNAIEVRGLCKQYSGFALNDINFCVPEGFCCGLVGPNGAGKTTILKAMTGMIKADSGEIYLLNRPCDAPVREELGILFDQPYFQEDWTPLNIERSIKPFYRNWDTVIYQDLLDRFSLDPRKKFKKFSNGMKQKLAMAVHLSHKSKLLLLDEPTSGLDPAARDEMLDLMREYLLKEGRTILFSTHITSDLEHLADFIVYISHGNLIFSGEKEEFTDSYCIVRGRKIPEKKRKDAIGLREYSSGFECLMELSKVGGLPKDAVTERAAIHDVIVFMERRQNNASDYKT